MGKFLGKFRKGKLSIAVRHTALPLVEKVMKFLIAGSWGDVWAKHYGKLALGILLSGICYQPLMESVATGPLSWWLFFVPSGHCKETAGPELELLKARQLIVSNHFSFLCSFRRAADMLR